MQSQFSLTELRKCVFFFSSLVSYLYWYIWTMHLTVSFFTCPICDKIKIQEMRRAVLFSPPPLPVEGSDSWTFVAARWPIFLCVCSVFSSGSVQLHRSQWPSNQGGTAPKWFITAFAVASLVPVPVHIFLWASYWFNNTFSVITLSCYTMHLHIMFPRFLFVTYVRRAVHVPIWSRWRLECTALGIKWNFGGQVPTQTVRVSVGIVSLEEEEEAQETKVQKKRRRLEPQETNNEEEAGRTRRKKVKEELEVTQEEE